MTMPRPLTITSVLAVPRSMPMSCENSPKRAEIGLNATRGPPSEGRAAAAGSRSRSVDYNKCIAASGTPEKQTCLTALINIVPLSKRHNGCLGLWYPFSGEGRPALPSLRSERLAPLATPLPILGEVHADQPRLSEAPLFSPGRGGEGERRRSPVTRRGWRPWL